MDKKGRILILDDLETWREQQVEKLTHADFHVESVSTVAEVLERLQSSYYHLLIIDISMEEGNEDNKAGLEFLRVLDKHRLSDATTVIIHSAYGTQERMRQAFRFHGVADFLSKDHFEQSFLQNVQQIFVEKVHVNLGMNIYWQQISGAAQAVLCLKSAGMHVEPDSLLQATLADELHDLLCRLFYQASSLLIWPLTTGYSGTGVLRVQPFYATGGGGNEVVVKFGEVNKIEQEYANFKHYVQTFLGGGRNTTVIEMRRTPHLGGIIYSLLGNVNDQMADFDEFYRHSDVAHITAAIDRLFHETCGAWYANHTTLEPLDLSNDYQSLLDIPLERLEQIVVEQLPDVKMKPVLTFSRLKTRKPFTNPFLALSGRSLVCSTYRCITHGDFNSRNLLVDSTGHVWMIDFQETRQSHILRDVALLDSAIRFQFLTATEVKLKERLLLEQTLCSIERFSQLPQLEARLSTTNPALAKAYAIVIHLRLLARKLVKQNPGDDMREYYVALLYQALNTIRFFSLSQEQREHALLCACLLADRLNLRNE